MRVLLADKAILFREGVAALLRQHGHEVVAQVENTAMLCREVAAQRPDLAVVDTEIPPDGEDVDTILRLRADCPRTGILLLAQRPAIEPVATFIGHGLTGFGYLLKDRVASVKGFLDAATRVADGESAFDPVVLAQLLARGNGRHLSPLSDREREVLDLMAQGLTNAGIARRLYLAERTVEGHVRNIFCKLRIHESPHHHRRVLAVLAYLGG